MARATWQGLVRFCLDEKLTSVLNTAVIDGFAALWLANDEEVSARIISIESKELLASAVSEAAELLASGEVVAVPTETVYGLAANALDSKAVSRIYQMKGRPSTNPLIVHLAGRDMIDSCVTRWDEDCDALSRSFWPGPLTMVLPKSPVIPSNVTAGGDTVGIRWPSHPFMEALIRRCDFPLAAPSANLANRLSPTTAFHVQTQLDDKLSLIVDGGACQFGIESTVVDMTGPRRRILRPGIIDLNALRASVADIQANEGSDEGTLRGSETTLRSPGLQSKHYAPEANLRIETWRDGEDLRDRIESMGFRSSDTHILAYNHIPAENSAQRICLIPHDPEAYARALYAELHQCDQLEAKLVLIEQIPKSSAWLGIADRLQRAAQS